MVSLAAKLSPPAVAMTQVVRKRLCDKLCAADAARLVLVQAPAGFGKTATMLQFRAALEARGVATAWLTLDRADNQATRFAKCMNLAIHSLSGEEQSEQLTADSIESLARCAPFAIFLDNFELIDEVTVLTLLRSIIEQLPRSGRIIIGTRSAPKLGLARLRSLGVLLDLDIDELRFSLDETEQYFRLRCLPGLSLESVSRLHSKTEGWIAGLWLASMSIERQGPGGDFVERFSGSTRAVADYLTEEVLAYQPDELRQFLLYTSILRHLNPSLCQALLPGHDSEFMLQKLDEQNLFLLPVPDEERTYRYHSLFANYLQTRLMVEQPEVTVRLHLAAARWYEARARPVPAIDHAIASGNYGYALSMLAPNAQHLLEEGRMRLLSRWFSAIPALDLRAHPFLEAISVWATLFTQGPWLAAEELQRSSCSASEDAHVVAHVSAQKPLILAMQDRYDEASMIGPESLARLPTCDAFADSVLCNAMANVFLITGEDRKAQRMIDDARRLRADSTFNHMYAESLEGMFDLQRGRLQAATAKFRAAVQATRDASHSYVRSNAWAGLLYAAVLYEINDLNGAEHLMNTYLPLVCDVVLPDHMIIGHTIWTRIAFERRDITKAFEVLTSLERLGHRRRLPRLVASAKLERSRLLLLQGDAQASMEELERAAESPVWERLERQRLPAHEVEYLKLARIRWDIHFGDARATLPRLQDEIDIAAQQSRFLRVMRLRILQSLALQRSGEPSAATETLAGILRQASREGFVRLLVDEGEGVGRLVSRFYSALEEMPAKRSDPVLVQYVQRLGNVFGPSAVSVGIPVDGQQMEPLTQKELQVLQLVADGHSNSTISERLAISDSTVRTHLRSVNSKLNARSRTEAVAIGRRMDMIR
ncbi:LuxR C-terminal-related transcriptional regulator [Bradyrhizobium oropedii]|uniref:LuxR C-terminal-related transcriptional regulator n=1 Tax=Bradyrhizobium oropedii TaxID=1571201 RepID=UPI0030841EEA